MFRKKIELNFPPAKALKFSNNTETLNPPHSYKSILLTLCQNTQTLLLPSLSHHLSPIRIDFAWKSK